MVYILFKPERTESKDVEKKRENVSSTGINYNKLK